MTLKEKLLTTQVVEDNEYLNKYIQLLENYTLLENTEGKKNTIEKHHIIPGCYFEQNNQPIDNSPENLKILYFRDHCLAHYYLFKCAKDSKFKASNACAVILMTSKECLEKDEKEFIHSLDGYQEAREVAREHISEITKKTMANPEIRQKISLATSKALSGKNHFNYGKHLKPSTCALIGKTKIGNKNNLGTKWSDELRLKVSKAKKASEILKNYIWINNNEEEFRIKPEKLKEYLAKGYKEGRLISSINNFGTQKGDKFSSVRCNKISETKKKNNKPHKIYTNGEINIWIYEDEEVPEGFFKGFTRKGQAKLNRKQNKFLYNKKRNLNDVVNFINKD